MAGVTSSRRTSSVLFEFSEAGVAHALRLLGTRHELALARTVVAKDQTTVPAVVLKITQESGQGSIM